MGRQRPAPALEALRLARRRPDAAASCAGATGSPIAAACDRSSCHAVDLYATVLDAAGIDAAGRPSTGSPQQPVDGRSLLRQLRRPGAPEHRALQYFEMMGSRGDLPRRLEGHDRPRAPTSSTSARNLVGSLDFDTDRWSLFRLADDFSESRDLADEHPDVVRRLEELWWAEAGRNQVLPLFEFPASMAHMHPGEFPPPTERGLPPRAADRSRRASCRR